MLYSLSNNSTPAEAARVIKGRGGVVALTGAGISVDSGIPDFRSPGGIWEKYEPAEYATIGAFMADPAKVWNMFRDLGAPLERARPNPGHLALKALEDLGHLTAVITQNIDNLHTEAGCGRVIELHGNAGRFLCMECRREHPRAAVEGSELGWPPACPRCGGLIKPDVVLFGEALPHKAISDAYEATAAARVLLTVGTSGIVSPANTIPYLAKKHGASIIEVNLEETVLTRSVSDYFVKGSASEVLPEIVRCL